METRSVLRKKDGRYYVAVDLSEEEYQVLNNAFECYSFLMKLATDGGCIVSSNDCSELQIAHARACNADRWLQIGSLGFLRRTKEQLERKDESIGKRLMGD